MKRIIFFLLCCLMAGSLSAQDKKMDLYISKLMSRMTLEQKIGQLNLHSAPGFISAQKVSEADANVRLLRAGQLGGIYGNEDPNYLRQMQDIAMKSGAGIPLIFGMDVIHGDVTVFPIPLATASSWNMNLIEEMAQTAAREASAGGVCWVFSPMVDIARDARWGRIAEGAGEDPYLGGEIAKAYVRGYQGDGSYKDGEHVMTCVKHFALYGAAESGKDYNQVFLDRPEAFNGYLRPYLEAVKAGAGSFMSSFNEFEGIPMTANRYMLTDVLRQQWGFRGFVVSDANAVGEVVNHGLGDTATVAARALHAGLDMDMNSDAFVNTLVKSLQQGHVTMTDIDLACRRVLEAKYKLGLFADPYRYLNNKKRADVIYSAENRAVARRMAQESQVLLKNDGILPLRKDMRIAVVGPLAASRKDMGGTWTLSPKAGECVSVLQGIKEAAADTSHVAYREGSWIYCDSTLEFNARYGTIASFVPASYQFPPFHTVPQETLINQAVKAAQSADVVVACVGETRGMSGESSSRTDLTLPDAQRQLLKALKATGKPVVMVLMTGRPLVLKEESQEMNAILNIWSLGTEGGRAVADVLFGDVNPSGKLTVSFPRSTGQEPLYYNHKSTGRPHPDGAPFKKFTNGYIDEPNGPLYPFGYGLSYTKFNYGPLRLSSDKLTTDGSVTASVSVTNNGSRDGQEVVQLYIHSKYSTSTRPVKELKGFRKIALRAGESKEVTFTITKDDLSYYNHDLYWVCEPGQYEIMVGPDCQTLQTQSLYY